MTQLTVMSISSHALEECGLRAYGVDSAQVRRLREDESTTWWDCLPRET